MATLDCWLLPDGIEEILPDEAARIEAARRCLLELFALWGYQLVITPHMEYLDSLLVGAEQDLDLRTFKMVDPLSGRLMGVRADITPQVARLDAHELKGEGPSRLCYAGTVLHAVPRGLACSRSPIQIGAELYGEASAAGDLEIISLMLDMLDAAGVQRVHMDLGHVGVYRGLAGQAKLSGQQEQALFDAVQRKAMDEVTELTADLTENVSVMIRALPELNGGYEIFEQARCVLARAPKSVQQALDCLQEIADGLLQRFPELPLYFDLGELRGYHYHTGAVFAAFVPGKGQLIAQGGRYDNIGAHFGRARPATGFSTDLKTLVSLGNRPQPEELLAVWAPHDQCPSLWESVRILRGQGTRVVQALPGQDADWARQCGCDRRLVKNESGWQVQPL